MPARVDEYFSNLNSKKLNLNYTIAGKADNIAPLKVFDDGHETSFMFKNKNLIIPSISAVDIFGTETALTYVIRDEFVVVSSIEMQFTFRLADSLLCVFNNDLVSGGQ